MGNRGMGGWRLEICKRKGMRGIVREIANRSSWWNVRDKCTRRQRCVERVGESGIDREEREERQRTEDDFT